MRTQKPGGKNRTYSALIAALMTTCCVHGAWASTYKKLLTLPFSTNRHAVEDVLSVDSSGRLYGTQSGIYGGVFVAYPQGPNKQHWNATALFDFSSYAPKGPTNPEGGVTLIGNALLVSTTIGGLGYGSINRIDTPTNPPPFTVLHNFAAAQASPPEGGPSFSGLTPGPGGYYYGTSAEELNAPGTVFAISGSATNPKYEVIHRFVRKGDRANPYHGRLLVDGQGRIFGTYEVGGAYGAGAVYMLQYAAGKWQYQQVYNFKAQGDLQFPVANVVTDAQGNVYGCAQQGSHGKGGIFRLAPPTQSGAAWTETVLYSFGDAPNDPTAASTASSFNNEGCGITIDPATNILYGTSYGGGTDDDGTIFSLSPPAAGQTAWTETIIHSFTNLKYSGQNPGRPHPSRSATPTTAAPTTARSSSSNPETPNPAWTPPHAGLEPPLTLPTPLVGHSFSAPTQPNQNRKRERDRA